MTHKIRPVVSHNLPDASHYVNAPSIKSLCNAWRDFIFLWEFSSILLFICKYQRDLLGPFLLLENQTKMCFRDLERHAL